MLNLKRFFIVILILFSLFVVTIGSSVYFLNINDYSEFISEKIKKSTGYDIHFESIENSWISDNRVSLAGLSVYQQEKRILYVKRVELKIDNLDLWQRTIDIQNIHLQGVDVDFQQLAKPVQSKLIDKEDPKKEVSDSDLLEWERLHIANLQITDLNANVQHSEQSLSLGDASIELNDLLIIDKKQLQTVPKNVDVTVKFNRLQASNSTKKIQVNGVSFSLAGDLLKRQADIELTAKEIQADLFMQTPLLFESLQIQLQIAENKISLVNFVVDTFSGNLMASVDAFLTINLLPKPAIKVQQLVLNSLIAKDMQITIPNMQTLDTHPKKENSDKLPVEEMLIKKVQLQNISIVSETEQLPLTVDSGSLQMNDFYLIKDNQLLDVTEYTQQESRFAVDFLYLRWQEIIIEQFSLAGSLNEDDQGLKALQQLFSRG